MLTEKMVRKGVHLTREYSTDPLEAFFARQVMTTVEEPPRINGAPPATVYADSTLREVANELARRDATAAAVIDRAAPGKVVGEITLGQLLHARREDLREEEQRERLLPLMLRHQAMTRQGRSARRRQRKETGRTPEKPAS